ncbi:kinase inhibitor [Clostridium botulinum]|uniref:Kinase inhibitor n=1 Tax=Clostridium botulinum TaxID=1491 RepID=A0A9Q1V0M8_CLOBO|nr:allophanate hydrolase subunit 1 [Clostridium botulinum]AEB76657.1 putative kinase inhibitor, KipI [Clostridium botulinum BKT015925]KEI03063.1 kinase inhibitor [Clostridium botulinum C/D str. Sp77]KOA79353.1 kinase inhibitor [Clostridium botulinum]KOA85569.1 kinase inhibitor [Clostridium botulinum]KOA88830.1 kinase inhibitor [Clostridium botulinum]
MVYDKLMTIKPMGDCAITLKFSEDINIDTHLKIKSLSEYLDKNPFKWMVEYVPSFVSLTIFYNPLEVIKEFSEKSDIPFNIVKSQIEKVLSKLEDKVIDNPKIVEIPVCYGGEFGPDLSFVAEHNNLTVEEVIDIHLSFENRVYMIGFAPGFPYLAGMSNRISTPGGWQLIGRTPVDLFNPQSESPSLLKAGDIVKFKKISRKEYYEIKYSKEEKILKWA